MAKVLCMEIGAVYTKIVEMDYQAKKPKVYRCLEVKTPEGAVKDGYLADDRLPALQETIKEALTANKIRTKRILFTIFSGRIINREILLPGVKPHQINAVIESNITEYFPIELSEYKISHMLIRTIREGENAGKHKVLVLAAEKALLAAYERLADNLGLHLVDIDYSGNGMLQAVKHNVGSEAAMIVKMEAENAIITIAQQGNLILQRNVNYARGRMGDVEISREEMLESLINTMLRVMDFYNSGEEKSEIEQIYVVGTSIRDDGIVEQIEEHTGISTRTLDVVRGVVVGRNIGDVAFCQYAAAIGSGMESVGFDNEKEKERNETNYVNASVLMIILCLVLAVTVLILALVPYNMAVLKQKDLADREQKYAEAKDVHDRYLGTKDLYDQIDYGNQLTQNSNDGILAFFEELEQKLPSDVEVSEFTSNDTQCVITLRVADKETAAGVINNMRGFESLSEVVVESMTEESTLESDKKELNSDNTTVIFTMTCTYLLPEITQPVPSVSSEVSTDAAQTVEE